MKKIVITTMIVIVAMTFTTKAQQETNVSFSINEAFITSVQASNIELQRKIIDLQNELEKTTKTSAYRDEMVAALEANMFNLKVGTGIVILYEENEKLTKRFNEMLKAVEASSSPKKE